MNKYTPEDLKEILELHKKWIENKEGGVYANLIGANLIGADLIGANLICADLGGANLRDANLGGANLIGANLRDANLGGANLGGANLIGANLRDANLGGANLGGANLIGANFRGANLFNTLGEKKYVKSFQIETYSVVYTSSILQIGCKKYTFQEWKDFDDETIKKMDSNASDFWIKWKETIFKIIEMSPALPTKDEQ